MPLVPETSFLGGKCIVKRKMGTFITESFRTNPELGGCKKQSSKVPTDGQGCTGRHGSPSNVLPKDLPLGLEFQNSQVGLGPENLLCTTLRADKHGGLGCSFKIAEPKMEGVVVPETPLGRELLFMNTHLVLCPNWLKALHLYTSYIQTTATMTTTTRNQKECSGHLIC